MFIWLHLSAPVSVQALAFECIDLQTSFSYTDNVFRSPRSRLTTEIKSSGQDQHHMSTTKYTHLMVVCLEKAIFHLCCHRLLYVYLSNEYFLRVCYTLYYWHHQGWILGLGWHRVRIKDSTRINLLVKCLFNSFEYFIDINLQHNWSATSKYVAHNHSSLWCLKNAIQCNCFMHNIPPASLFNAWQPK